RRSRRGSRALTDLRERLPRPPARRNPAGPPARRRARRARPRNGLRVRVRPARRTTVHACGRVGAAAFASRRGGDGGRHRGDVRRRQEPEGTVTPRYVRPGWFTRHVFNPMVAALTRAGLSVWGSRELRVRGRRSGEWRATPVNLLSHDGNRYLVAP